MGGSLAALRARAHAGPSSSRRRPGPGSRRTKGPAAPVRPGRAFAGAESWCPWLTGRVGREARRRTVFSKQRGGPDRRRGVDAAWGPHAKEKTPSQRAPGRVAPLLRSSQSSQCP